MGAFTTLKRSTVNVGFKNPTIDISGSAFAGSADKGFEDSHSIEESFNLGSFDMLGFLRE